MSEVIENTQKYGFWATIPFSFFSQGVYRDVAKRKSGANAYISLIAGVMALVVALVMVISIKPFMRVDELTPFLSQLPDTIEMKNSEMILPEERPYFISVEEEPFAVFDATGEYTLEDLGAETGLYVLFAKEYVAFYEQDRREIKTERYANMEMEDFSLTREQIYEWVDSFIQDYGTLMLVGLFFVTAIFMALFLALYKLVQILFFSLLGLILNAVLSLKLDYADIFRITAVTFIPITAIDSLLTFLLPSYSLMIFFGLAVGYIVFAMTSLKKGNANLEMIEQQ